MRAQSKREQSRNEFKISLLTDIFSDQIVFKPTFDKFNQVEYIFSHIPKEDSSLISKQNLLLAQELKSIQYFEFFKHIFYGFSIAFPCFLLSPYSKVFKTIKVPLLLILPTVTCIILS